MASLGLTLFRAPFCHTVISVQGSADCETFSAESGLTMAGSDHMFWCYVTTNVNESGLLLRVKPCLALHEILKQTCGRVNLRCSNENGQGAYESA